MSRRYSHRHLERTEAVAAVVEDELASRGPCPGQCNRLYRARLGDRDRVVADVGERLLAEAIVPFKKYAPAELDAIAAEISEAARVEGEKVRVPEPRPGRPVWCLRCSSDIRHAVESIPQLVAWVLDIGSPETPRRPPSEPSQHYGSDGLPVTAPVEVLEMRALRHGLAVEVLACGHRVTRALGPAPARRVCRTCVASAITPEGGRLAPPPKAAVGKKPGGPKVSPAGSPAWVEADAAIQWVCSRTEQARVLLDRRLDGADGEYGWREGSAAFRYREAARAARHLRVLLEELLESSAAESYGREALAVAGRLRTVSGSDVLVHRLPASCPRCKRRAMERTDGSGYVRCRACGAHWEETHYQHLARVQAWEANHPEMQEQTS